MLKKVGEKSELIVIKWGKVSNNLKGPDLIVFKCIHLNTSVHSHNL